MKIAVLSGVFVGYGSSLAKAFEELGNEVKNFDYSRANNGFIDIFKHSIPSRLGFDTEKADRKEYFNRVLAEIETFRPDAIMVATGMLKDFYSEIITSYRDKIGKRVPTAIWCMDSYKRIPGKLQSKTFFDHWFILEPSDIPLIKKEAGIDGDFLPSGYNSDLYYPISSPLSKKYTTDLSFVGAAGYENRRGPLEYLAKKSFEENWNFKIITDYSRLNRLRFHNYPNLRKSLVHDGPNHARNNNIYNSCRVNFNIHHVQCIEGLNPRFFEIMGSGGLQIVEPKKAQTLLGFEPDKDFLTYTGLEELVEKIKFVLDHPEKGEEIARSGHEKAKEHSFLYRAKYIMERAFTK